MSFEVKIEVFEGPFDLLLQLIMKQEVDIYQVPVAAIASSYLQHIEDTSRFDLDTATEFLLIAATLLLIKARALLPSDEEADDEGESESAREFLIERLIEYRTYSGAAEWLADRYASEGWYTPRLREIESDYADLYPDPFEGVEARALAEALLDLALQRATDTVDVTYIAPIRVSVAERIELVRELLGRGEKSTFSELISDCGSKIEVIATFLAVLELFKRGELALTQRKLFGEITVTKREGDRSGVA